MKKFVFIFIIFSLVSKDEIFTPKFVRNSIFISLLALILTNEGLAYYKIKNKNSTKDKLDFIQYEIYPSIYSYLLKKPLKQQQEQEQQQQQHYKRQQHLLTTKRRSGKTT